MKITLVNEPHFDISKSIKTKKTTFPKMKNPQMRNGFVRDQVRERVNFQSQSNLAGGGGDFERLLKKKNLHQKLNES